MSTPQSSAFEPLPRPPAALPAPSSLAEPVTEPAAAEPARKPRQRDPFFDNAKFFAILLVVAGHIIQNLRDVHFAHALYLFVYTFHMPVFIVITGYFTRRFTFAGGKARKLLTNVAVPYFVFETAYSTYHWAVGHSKFELSLLDPYYLTWFLMALFAWRLSTPVWQQIRFPIAVAVVISLLSGMSQLPGTLEMNRVFGLVPFYVLGLFLKPQHFEILKKGWAAVLGALTMVGGFAVTYLFVDRHMATEWVYWRTGNPKLHVNNLVGTGMRLGLLVAATVLVMAFLTLVPRRQHWFTSLGSATLYAYLLHGFATKLADYYGWYDVAFLHTVPGVVAAGAAGALLATLLCTPPVRWLMHWALEPNMAWAFTALRRPKNYLYSGRRRRHAQAEPEQAG
ncbi:acyltransferase family protein [Actinoallomurus oryzae]|uniref:Acyltransferase family protein n=1 Tax=Actinoallomurus oryzae TaxID=502180 RepID=A0ABP8PW52_9ACTN